MAAAPDTFASLQTPAGAGPIAVILLAGPDAGRIISDVFRPRDDRASGPAAAGKKLTVGQLLDGGDLIDEAVVAVSGGRAAADKKLTVGQLLDGGDLIDEAVVAVSGSGFEINIHGGTAVVAKTLTLLASRGAAIVPADRAVPAYDIAHPKWHNPAIGAEMLRAIGPAASCLAVAAITSQWSAGLSELVSGRPGPAALRRAAAGLEQIKRLCRPAEVVPNAGKSTLANALVGRAVSIVHETPGTTRDWVREIALLDGVPIWLTDTAGLWQAAGPVDAEAVRRARQCVAAADLVVLLAAGAVPEPPDWLTGRDGVGQQTAGQDVAGRVVKVSAKADLSRPTAGRPDVLVSAHTGEGLAELKDLIVARLGLAGFDPSAPAAFTDRQASLLIEAASAMDTGLARRQADGDAALRRLLAGSDATDERRR